jgi:RNA polymerase sigma-70 factor (ECF subfamily)
MPSVPEEFREAIVELLPRLRRLARALVGNVHEADDLVQITIERALSRAQQWREDSPLPSWMFGILRNAWIDEVRVRRRRGRVLVAEELGEHVADPAANTYAEALSVQAAVAQLPAEQREVVGLVLVEGLSYKEAAEVTGAPIGTVTSRLARAREALQALLRPDDGVGP